jgi:hypothetical protein
MGKIKNSKTKMNTFLPKYCTVSDAKLRWYHKLYLIRPLCPTCGKQMKWDTRSLDNKFTICRKCDIVRI